MKKCLLTTLPSNDIGLLTRSLPIAEELVKLGLQVTFCNPAKSPGLLIKEAGFNGFDTRFVLVVITALLET